MKFREKLATFLYGLVALTNLVMGGLYLSRQHFMPYHSRAVGVGWDQLLAGERELILALMRLGGAGFLAVGVAIAVLLMFPFRRGEPWARWALPAVGLLFWALVFVVTVLISVNSPAAAPWPWSGLTVIVLIVAAALSLRPGERPQAPSVTP